MTRSRRHNAHPKRRTNEGAENYAKAIYELQGRSDEPVAYDRSRRAARRHAGVGVRDAQAPGGRGAGRVRALPRGPPHPDGRAVALEMIRHHRLIELFLAEVLGMPWDRVHEEAEVLEHHISEELEELIAAKLGQPALDPHGDPIPDRDLEISADDSVAAHRARSRASRASSPASPTATPRCSATSPSARSSPGARLPVTGKEPFGGPVMVEIAAQHAPARAGARRRACG